MRIKSVIALALAVLCLLLIITGVSTAQQDEPSKANLDYKVYLPIIAKPSCEVAAYVTASSPVVEVGQFFTVTGAIVNIGCPPIGQRWIVMGTAPSGATLPEGAVTVPGGVIPTGQYQIVQTRFQALQTGPVTFSLAIRYNSWSQEAVADPSVIRIVPHNP